MFARAVCWCVEFLALFGLWLLFVDHLVWTETAAGIAAAGIAATAAEIVRGQEHPRFRPRAALLADFWPIPGAILTDSLLLLRKLARMLFRNDRGTGRFVTVPFPAGDAGARSVALRALAILYTTLPPNTLVIGIDRKQHVLLLHQLEPANARILGGRG